MGTCRNGSTSVVVGLVALIGLVALTGCTTGRSAVKTAPEKAPLDRPASAAERPVPATVTESPKATVVLGGDGLGVARFGDEAEGAMASLAAVLGAPDRDTGWTGSFSEFGTCPGQRVRGQVWKAFTALFVEGATDLRPDGRAHLFGFLYGGEGQPSSPHLVTAEGIGLGSTVQDLKGAYGSRLEIFYDEVTQRQAFRVGASPRELFGLLSGEGPGDRVVFIAGGGMCGE